MPSFFFLFPDSRIRMSSHSSPLCLPVPFRILVCRSVPVSFQKLLLSYPPHSTLLASPCLCSSVSPDPLFEQLSSNTCDMKHLLSGFYSTYCFILSSIMVPHHLRAFLKHVYQGPGTTIIKSRQKKNTHSHTHL
ncbi:hypothetical protein BO71DRAFT_200237 [Aspergillus ellipticus CBS 707.79]|uniref:Uncharacterized protein n=1 Tax=Aspergillus ellipticus CBS 707.79 TaxID=1448320 RepID=A0A319DEC5_9EURO|nr:hypothetical protein BO71DRAFT_200237 [Aspergillus ellipticus CBS 707.79]